MPKKRKRDEYNPNWPELAHKRVRGPGSGVRVRGDEGTVTEGEGVRGAAECPGCRVPGLRD